MQLFEYIVYFSACLEYVKTIITIYRSISASEENYAIIR